MIRSIKELSTVSKDELGTMKILKTHDIFFDVTLFHQKGFNLFLFHRAMEQCIHYDQKNNGK